MTARYRFRQAIVSFMLFSVLNPLTASGQSPASRRTRRAMPVETPTSDSAARLSRTELRRATVHDIRLDQRQQFHGVVVDGQGQAVKACELRLRRTAGHGDPLEARTDEHGRFVFSQVHAGTYQLETEQGVSVCRLWTADAAPPSAAPSLLVVDDPLVERGQRPLGELFVMDPVLMATVVAAAVAIPIVIHKSRDDAPPGS